MPAIHKEEAFAELVREYENMWIAIIEEGDRERVVGSGKTPTEALAEARTKGFEDAVLFSVPSFSRSLIY